VTDRIALGLAIVITALVATDLLANSGEALLFLAHKLTDLIYYLAFWRR
jgi:hypothetical protein